MGYSVKQFSPEIEKQDLILLWSDKSNIPGGDLNSKYDFLYGEHRISDVLTFLLLNDKEQKPVGCASLFFRTFQDKVQNVKIGIHCDILVKKQHRTLGPALIVIKKLVSKAKEIGTDLLVAMPNKMSEQVFARSGFAKIGQAYRWSKVIKSRSKLSFFKQNELLRSSIGSLIDIFMYLFSMEAIVQIFYCCFRPDIQGSMNTDEILLNDEFLKSDSLFDCPPGYLNWRYQGLSKHNSFIFSINLKKRVQALLVYYIEDREVIIEELLGERRFYAVLLAKFISFIRKSSFDSISLLFFGDIHFKWLLQGFGLLKRGGRPLYIHNLDNSNMSFLSQMKKSVLFDGELDL